MRDPQRYLEPRPRWRAAVWGAAFVLLALAGLLTHGARENYQMALLHEEAATRARVASQPKPKPKPSRSEMELQKRWASLESELAFAWYPIFLALESASNEEIELLEFAPDKAARRVVLRGEARDLNALFAYVQAVSEQPAFRQVYLAQQKNKTNGALTTIEFELRAQIR